MGYRSVGDCVTFTGASSFLEEWVEYHGWCGVVLLENCLSASFWSNLVKSDGVSLIQQAVVFSTKLLEVSCWGLVASITFAKVLEVGVG